jgi:histone H2B
MGISKKGMLTMNNYIQDMLERLLNETNVLTKFSKNKTLSSRCVQSATKLVIQGELCKHAISEGTKAVNKYASIVA